MQWFGQQKVLAAASAWKRERLATLEARIELHWRLLASLQAELAELQALQGTALAARFGCETPEDIAQTMQGHCAWLEELKAWWLSVPGTAVCAERHGPRRPEEREVQP